MATRRSNGEGSLSWNEARQRWVGRASLGYNADGKRRIGTVSARTKTEARTKLRALLCDHDDGLPTQRTYTVGDAFGSHGGYALDVSVVGVTLTPDSTLAAAYNGWTYWNISVPRLVAYDMRPAAADGACASPRQSRAGAILLSCGKP